MNKFIVAAILAPLAGVADAGEFRGSLGYESGQATYEHNAYNKIDADRSEVGIAATYFLDEAGPFFGIGFAKGELGTLEFNGASSGLSDIEYDDTTFTVGYRDGSYGQHQLVLAGTYGIADLEGGEDDEVVSVSVGVEKSTKVGRYHLGASYATADDTDAIGLGVSGMLYNVNEQFGLGARAGYSIGDTKILGSKVDTIGWYIGVGVEYRVLN